MNKTDDQVGLTHPRCAWLSGERRVSWLPASFSWLLEPGLPRIRVEVDGFVDGYDPAEGFIGGNPGCVKQTTLPLRFPYKIKCQLKVVPSII